MIDSPAPEIWDEAGDSDRLAEYDALFESDATDADRFYLRGAAECGGPIVELGSGSGRLVAVFAEAGFEVTGVEPSPVLAQRARQRTDALDPVARSRVRTIVGDLLAWRSDAASLGLIVLARDALCRLHSDRDRVALLVACRDALRSTGVLAMELSLVGSGPHRNWGDRRGDGTLFYDGCVPDPVAGNGGMVQRFHADALDERTSTLLRTVLFDHVSPSGEVRRVILRQRRAHITPEQLTSELDAAGFRSVAVYGGFELEPLFDSRLAGGGRQVCIARP